MSFGLANAPPTFSRMMNFIFNAYTNDFVLVYLNDILVFLKNKEDHAKHLRLVLDKLRDNSSTPSSPSANFGSMRFFILVISSLPRALP